MHPATSLRVRGYINRKPSPRTRRFSRRGRTRTKSNGALAGYAERWAGATEEKRPYRARRVLEPFPTPGSRAGAGDEVEHMRRKPDDLEALEHLLARELVPVHPESAFLEEVESRLQEPRSFEVAPTEPGQWAENAGAWFLMGMGLALFLTGLGLWVWWKNRRVR